MKIRMGLIHYQPSNPLGIELKYSAGLLANRGILKAPSRVIFIDIPVVMLFALCTVAGTAADSNRVPFYS